MSHLTLQLLSPDPCFHTPWQKRFPLPHFSSVWGKSVCKLGGNSGVFSQMPKMEALRTGTETKLLHSFIPWSRGGCTHLCNLELLCHHHAMLNFQWSCFCKVDLKKGSYISVIFNCCWSFSIYTYLTVHQHLEINIPITAIISCCCFTIAGPEDQ